MTPPTRVWDLIRALKAGTQDAYVGSNPLGASKMLTLICVVLCLGVTGWMQILDAFWGEEWR